MIVIKTTMSDMDAYSRIFPLDNSLGFQMYKTALALKANLQRMLRDEGLDVTPEQWSVIMRLWEEEGLTQKEIAERTFKDKANITRLIDALEKKGMVYRKSDADDRRRYRIFLTKEGSGLQNRMLEAASKALRRATAGVSDFEIESVRTVLKKIYDNVERV